MSCLLVAGDTGFIGSHVADHLIDADHEVVVLNDLSGGFEENVSPRAFSQISGVAPYLADAINIPEGYKQMISIAVDIPLTLNTLAGEIASLFGVRSDSNHLPPATKYWKRMRITRTRSPFSTRRLR